MRVDPYAVEQVFDDVYESLSWDSAADEPQLAIYGLAEEVASRVLSNRLPTPGMKFEVLGHHRNFEILGGIEDKPKPPLFKKIWTKFKAALPASKVAVVEIERRVSDMEKRFSDHINDEHGGLNWLSQLEDAYLDYKQNEDILGGYPIVSGKKVECCQVGDEIVCKIRFLFPDGSVRSVITGGPAQKYVDEVLGCVYGLSEEEVYAVVPPLAQALGAISILGELCRAHSSIISSEEVLGCHRVIGTLKSKSEPDMAAAMTLLQRCQMGDMKAIREAEEIKGTWGRDLICCAGETLTRAQREKRRRV